ncbi:MAG: helix-turn-helix transcriptional regulator [Candidatus Competibacteraceae bacterium]|nr:helix-turn-helix transcriptional regulator [Candidatus Competibacteraceae bacterium]
MIDFQAKLVDLTAREAEVLCAIIAGYSTVAIAFWFGISPKTVSVHRAHIYKKLGVKGISNLTRLAIASGVQPLRSVHGRR